MSNVPDKPRHESDYEARIHAVEPDKALAMSTALGDPFVRHIANLELLEDQSTIDWMNKEPVMHAIAHVFGKYPDIKRDGPAAKAVYEEARTLLTLEKYNEWHNETTTKY